VVFMETRYILNSMNKDSWQLKAKRMLREKKVTMDMVGDRMHLKRSSISLKLNGKVACTADEILIIASMLDITVDQLLADSPNYLAQTGRQVEAKAFINGYNQLNDEQKTMILQLMETMQD